MDEFQNNDSGTSLTTPIRAGEIKKGMIVMLKDHPCKVNEVTTSKTGKHGHAKASITGLDIFTGKKYIDISPTSHNMTKPVVSNKSYLLCDINDEDFTSLMDEETSEIIEHIKLPGENTADPKLGITIRKKYNESNKDIFVTVTSAMNREEITSCSEGIA